MVRLAKREDFEEIAQMAGEFSEQAGLPFRIEDFWNFCVSPTTHLIVDDDLRGMLIAVLTPWVGDSRFHMAQEIAWWIKPEHRDSGLGRELLEYFMSYAEEKGAHVVSMSSLEDDKADKLYEKMGFTKRETAYVKVI